MNRPLVSVVVPTLDRRALLAQALRTVLGQERVAIEVIVVDDGSQDDTPAALAAIRDDRLRVLRRDRPSNCAAARNAGAAMAHGRWLAFVDDDDLWAPDKLRAQVDAAVADDATWSCTGAVSVDERLNVIGAHVLDARRWRAELPVRNTIPAGASTVMVRRDVFDAAGGFDDTLPVMEDWDMWNRLSSSGRLAGVHRPLTAYRRHDGSISRLRPAVREAHRTILRRYASETGSSAATLEWFARQQLERGDRAAAALTYVGIAQAGLPTRGLLMAVAGPLAAGWWRQRWRRRALAGVPEHWGQEAECWLRPLRVAQ